MSISKMTFSLASLIVFMIAGLALLTPSIVEADNVTLTAPADQASWDAGVTAVNLQLPAGTHQTVTGTDDAADTFTYSLSPGLPAGLQINTAHNQRRITGVPTKGFKAKEYTWTATAANGHKASQKFMIQVNSAPMFDPATKSDPYISKVDKVVNISLPEATDADGDDVESYALTPNLDGTDGLVFVASTRRITGAFTGTVPTTNEGVVEYTLTATGGTGQAPTSNEGTYTFKIKYIANNTLALASISDAEFTVDKEGTHTLPTAMGIDADFEASDVMYDLSPALPAGLRLVDKTIIGTPTTAAAKKEYTWKATDPDGEVVMKKFGITVKAMPVAVSFGGASVSDQEFMVGTLKEVILPPAATNTGTGDLTYSLTPKLPKGLMFNAASRVLSGTATAAAAAAEYTYKVEDSADPKTSDMLMFNITVNAADGTPVVPANAPAKPAAPTAMINPANDLTIDVSWTAPADGGSPITGYTVKKYGSDGMLVKTFPETGDPAITATMLSVGPVPAADRGMSFTFTVTAMNANGAGPESDKSDAVMIPAAQTVANNAPTFQAGASIDDIIIWQGYAYVTDVLPKARDNEGDDISYEIMDLPAGFELLADDSEDRVIEVREANKADTVAMKTTEYSFVAMDQHGAKSDPVKFNITVLAPIVPTAPTAVMAMEEGDLGGLTENRDNRRVNSNKVVVNWTAPVDTTKTSHDPAIPFGAPITGYKVYQTDENGSAVVYPRTNDDPIKKDAADYTTPVLSVPGSKVGRGTYNFEVAAVNSVGTGKKSEPKAPALVADPPNQPSDLRASKVPTDPNSTTLDWLLPSDDGGTPIRGYAIYQTLDGGPEVQIDNIGLAITHRVPNLEAGRHVFRIAAFNDDGLGNRSISTAFTVDVPLDPTNNPPTFGDKSITHIAATVGTAITGVTLPAATDADGDTISYAISPRLPTGLRFEAGTRFLHGTPRFPMVSTIYTYTAVDGEGGSAALNFSIEVKRAPTTPDTPPVTTLPPGTAHITGSHDAAMGEVTLRGSIAANGFGVVMADILPNLEEFFSRGGTITLDDGADTAAKTVVISEILWGLDLGEPAATQKNRQFIELYNTNISGGASVSVTGWKLKFKEGRPAPANDVDQVSNVAGRGWIVDVGQSGRVTGTTLMGGTVAPVDIISMYRKINYLKVQNTDGGDAAKRFEGFPGGNAKGSWAASTRVTTDAGVKSSPGRQNFKAVVVKDPTDVPSSPFVINEIGNGSGGTNDWIEFRNVTDAEQSLKNYQLSVVTGTNANDKKDTQLFHFHDKDYKVPAKGIIVVYSTHPRNTDLAQGKDVSVADDDEENRGTSHLFVVRSFNLPDSGKTLLILRNNHEGNKLGTVNNIIDVVGTLGIAIKTADFETKRWPLLLSGAPHGNVIEPGAEELSAGKVYTRANAGKGSGSGEKHIGVAGYTGLGYDRAATPNAANGGTPGYDNGAIKGKLAELSGTEVTFSEIMLDVGTGRVNLPQWIEVYNNSMTQTVNTNGWKLTIENANDVDTALDAVLTLGDMKISPNQTILIVTNSGRVSDPDHFPSNRVVNLWTTKAHRDALGTSRRTDQVFSTTGLYLKLTDAENKLVDEFGNLDGNRRTRDAPNWTIPMGENGEDRRSSLIRIYASDDNPSTRAVKDAKGTNEDAWVLADKTSLAFAISQTYYGDPDDYGTPGFRGGGPLPVSLSKFRPERLESGEVVVRWVTESELHNAGFNILRSEKRDGEFTKVHFVAGQGTTSERTTYEWKDKSAKPNVVYYYQIQDVSLDGQVQTLRQSRLKGYISPAGKLTTVWGKLKALQ